jgi:hypothetical protein
MSQTEREAAKAIISVYLDDGRVYSYSVENADKVREHTAAIATSGYRHNDGTIFEHYPAWRILKVKAVGCNVPTKYTDTASGTQ